TCPEHALTPARHRPAVDDRRCTDCLACLEVCPVDAIVPLDGAGPAADASAGGSVGPVHPIEVESYRPLSQRVDPSARPPGERDVVARMVHATADESFAT